MRVGRFAAVALIGVMAGAVAGCGSDAEITVSGDDPRILVDQRDPDETVIQPITGHYTVRYDPVSSCVYLENGGLPPAWNAVWPGGTQPVVDGQRRGVNVPGAGHFVEGDVVLVTRATIEFATRQEGQSEGMEVDGLEDAWDSCGPERSLMFVYTIERFDE